MPKHVLLACMPKSGSTFMSNAIAALPNFNHAVLVPDWGRREQELDEGCLDRVAALNYVAQVHVRYSNATRDLIAKHDILPIVLVRNIFDVVPSFVDHHRKEGLFHPMAYVPDGIQEWSFEESARFVTAMIIPWYFNFYMSWNEVPNKLIVKYEDWISQPELQLSRICHYLQLEINDDDIRNAVSSVIDTSPRKNVITPGRGKALPFDCVCQVREMASFYRGVDFSEIGIRPERRSIREEVIDLLRGKSNVGKALGLAFGHHN